MEMSRVPLRTRVARDSTKVDQQRVLLDVAMQFGATLDLERLLPLVLDRMVGLLGAERAMFGLFDDQGRIERDVVHNIARTPGMPPPISNSAIAEVLDRKTSFRFDEATKPWKGRPTSSVVLYKLKFVLAVPVFARQRVAGVLYVDSSAPHMGDFAQHMETLEALARLVGTAVENAELFEAEQFRTAWLCHLAHDLRSPLTVVSMCSEELREASWPDPSTQELSNDISVSTLKMRRLIENTLRLVEVNAGAEVTHTSLIDLGDVLRANARTLRLLALRSGKRIEVRSGDLPRVHTVETRLDVVLDNLLFNALKFCPTGGTITVTTARRDDLGPRQAVERQAPAASQLFRSAQRLRGAPGTRYVEVSVHNDGPAIPDDVLQKLFRPYARGVEVHEGYISTGLGLAIVDQCVRSMGGCVWATSSTDAGTTVTFTLPTSLVA